jgi:hypothetical protein
MRITLLMMLLAAGCAGEVVTPTVSEIESLGDPQNGFPNAYERALFMAANRTRSDPSTVKGSASTIYPAAAPLVMAYDLERSSRFHVTMLSQGHAPLMHPSPCTLAAGVGAATSTCDGNPTCGCAGGTDCNTCTSTACTAGTDPGTRIADFFSGASMGWGEIIAAGYPDAWSTMDGWVDEAAGSDGHRQIVTSKSYTVAGFGHASDSGACWSSFDGGDFASTKVTASPIASAAPKPIAGPAGTFRVYATWADSGGAPASLYAVVDGKCQAMVKELGDPTLNATYYADVPLTNGCHNVYALGKTAGGVAASYPATTAFDIDVGNVANCPDSVPQPVADCAGGATPPADMAQRASDMAERASGDMSRVAPADMSRPAARDMSAPPASPPSVTLLAPKAGAHYSTGATVVIQASATAAGGHAIVKAVANWSRFGYTTAYPLTLSGGVWTTSLGLSTTAGTRTLNVTATDDAGRATTTPSVSISVQ